MNNQIIHIVEYFLRHSENIEAGRNVYQSSLWLESFPTMCRNYFSTDQHFSCDLQASRLVYIVIIRGAVHGIPDLTLFPCSTAVFIAASQLIHLIKSINQWEKLMNIEKREIVEALLSHVVHHDLQIAASVNVPLLIPQYKQICRCVSYAFVVECLSNITDSKNLCELLFDHITGGDTSGRKTSAYIILSHLLEAYRDIQTNSPLIHTRSTIDAFNSLKLFAINEFLKLSMIFLSHLPQSIAFSQSFNNLIISLTSWSENFSKGNAMYEVESDDENELIQHQNLHDISVSIKEWMTPSGNINMTPLECLFQVYIILYENHLSSRDPTSNMFSTLYLVSQLCNTIVSSVYIPQDNDSVLSIYGIYILHRGYYQILTKTHASDCATWIKQNYSSLNQSYRELDFNYCGEIKSLLYHVIDSIVKLSERFTVTMIENNHFMSAYSHEEDCFNFLDRTLSMLSSLLTFSTIESCCEVIECVVYFPKIFRKWMHERHLEESTKIQLESILSSYASIFMNIVISHAQYPKLREYTYLEHNYFLSSYERKFKKLNYWEKSNDENVQELHALMTYRNESQLMVQSIIITWGQTFNEYNIHVLHNLVSYIVFAYEKFDESLSKDTQLENEFVLLTHQRLESQLFVFLSLLDISGENLSLLETNCASFSSARMIREKNGLASESINFELWKDLVYKITNIIKNLLDRFKIYVTSNSIGSNEFVLKTWSIIVNRLFEIWKRFLEYYALELDKFEESLIHNEIKPPECVMAMLSLITDTILSAPYMRYTAAPMLVTFIGCLPKTCAVICDQIIQWLVSFINSIDLNGNFLSTEHLYSALGMCLALSRSYANAIILSDDVSKYLLSNLQSQCLEICKIIVDSNDLSSFDLLFKNYDAYTSQLHEFVIGLTRFMSNSDENSNDDEEYVTANNSLSSSQIEFKKHLLTNIFPIVSSLLQEMIKSVSLIRFTDVQSKIKQCLVQICSRQVSILVKMLRSLDNIQVIRLIDFLSTGVEELINVVDPDPSEYYLITLTMCLLECTSNIQDNQYKDMAGKLYRITRNILSRCKVLLSTHINHPSIEDCAIGSLRLCKFWFFNLSPIFNEQFENSEENVLTNYYSISILLLQFPINAYPLDAKLLRLLLSCVQTLNQVFISTTIPSSVIENVATNFIFHYFYGYYDAIMTWLMFGDNEHYTRSYSLLLESLIVLIHESNLPQINISVLSTLQTIISSWSENVCVAMMNKLTTEKLAITRDSLKKTLPSLNDLICSKPNKLRNKISTVVKLFRNVRFSEQK